jgi:hypothetical protein
MKTSLKITTLIAVALAVLGQASASAQQPSSTCQNVFAEGSGALAYFEVAPGVSTIIYPAQPVTLGNVPGMMSSIVTSLQPASANGNGALHATLVHTFVSTDPNRVGSFTTSDQAVCAPAGKNGAVCRVNDVLTIVDGDGIFENATGSLRNHGIIDLANMALSYSIRGRMCGDGL